MDKRYFSIEEANAMIPDLELAFGRMLQLHAQIREVYQRLDASGFAPESDSFDLAPEGAPPDTLDDLASLRTLVDALRDDMQALHERGCLVKGVEQGLIDWYTRSAGRDVLLCWKLGEKEVGWWHEVEAGFAGRRPLSELPEDTAH